MRRPLSLSAVVLLAALLAASHSCVAQDFGKTVEFSPEDGVCGDVGPWLEGMCSTDAEGNENEFCEPCLVGMEWDALRVHFGTNLIQGYRSTVPTVKYAEWMSQTLQSSAFRIILKELLGYEVVRTATTSSVFELEEAASDTCQAINLEVWYTEPDVETALVTEGKLVLSDFMGTLGAEGLYFPTYMPLELLRYQSLTIGGKAAELLAQFPADGSMFSTDKLDEYFPDGSPWGCDDSDWPNSTCVAGRWYPPQCGSTYPSPNCAELYIPVQYFSAGWWESAIINLGLNFSVVYTTNEGLTDSLEEIHSAQKGALYYMWEPDPLHAKYPSVQLRVPLHTQDCLSTYNYDPLLSGVNCSRSVVPLRKVMNTHQATSTDPDIGALFDSWYISREQMNELLAFQAEGGGAYENPYQAACQWLKSSSITTSWKSWVQIADPCAGRDPVHVLDQASGTCMPAEDSDIPEEAEGSLIFPWWWIVLAVSGCVVLAAVIALLVMKVANCKPGVLARDPPGKGSQVTIVITDIEASTSLWDLFPDQAARGIAIHHQCLRSSLAAFRGYEVATEGDSFKVAFHTAEDAICWATQIQLDLLCAPWDAELEELGTKPLPLDASGWANVLKIPKKKEDDPLPDASVETSKMKVAGTAVQQPVFPVDLISSNPYSQYWQSKAQYGCVTYANSHTIPIFRGMRVRVGMHTGIADVVGRHEITKRVTYGGRVVALAKAVSDTGCGGQIMISGETMAAISSMQDFMYRVTQTFKSWRSALDGGQARSSIAIVHCGSHMLQQSCELGKVPSRQEKSDSDGDGRAYRNGKGATDTVLTGAQQKLLKWGSGRFPAAADLPKKMKYTQELLMVVPEPLRARVRCYPKLNTEEPVTPSYFDAPNGGDTTIMFSFIHSWSRIKAAIEDKAVLQATCAQYALLVRSCLVQHKGYEVEGEDDSFVCAFHNPVRAVSCAIDIQGRILAAQWHPNLLKNQYCEPVNWSDGTLKLQGPRVRIGMCTGRASKSHPCLRTGRRLYFGSLMNHAARVTNQASGGQVLLHQKTYSALNTDRLDPEISVSKLAKFNLKGIKKPITIYEASLHTAYSSDEQDEDNHIIRVDHAVAETTMTARNFLAKYLLSPADLGISRRNSMDISGSGSSSQAPHSEGDAPDVSNAV